MSDLISRSGLESAIKRQYCTGCDNYNGSRCRACHADDMLSLVDDAADAQRWISVEERLPEDGKNVLVHVTNPAGWWNVDVDWRTEGGWAVNADSDWHIVTHWMPLPEPPKEDA